MNQAEYDFLRERAARAAGLVAWVFHMEPATLFRVTRGDAEEAFARHVAMYLVQVVWPEETYDTIGQAFLGRHRSSVEHAIAWVSETCEASPEFDAQMEWLADLLRRGHELGHAYLTRLMHCREAVDGVGA